MHKVSVSSEIRERLIARRGRYHIFEKLPPAQTALVVIDMQNAFCAPGAPAEVPASRGIVTNINELAAALRPAGVEIIWVVSAFDHHQGRTDWENFFNHIVSDSVRENTLKNMQPGGDGTKLWPEMDRHEGDMLITKNRYSCLVPGTSPLERILRSRGIDTLLLTGTKTNICCETAARAAFDMDFRPVLVEDCCAALSDREHLAALENVIQQFGDVMTSSEVRERIQ